MALHEEWREYSTKEINDIKKRHCAKCKYSKRLGTFSTDQNKNVPDLIKNPNGRAMITPGQLYCDYLMITGHARGCRPEECKHYKEDRK